MLPRVFRGCLLVLMGLGALPAAYVNEVNARTLTVEGVVSPAWIERAGTREPLRAGMQLSNQDKVLTGENARALLRFTEGSAVKLGANATLALDQLTETQNADKSTLVSASLDVLKGAFRFTTGVFGRPRAQRDISVKFATVTAGIRGTDVWGRSSGTDDLVCLLEGRISVRHDNKETALTEPLQTFVVPRNAPANPLSKVTPQQSRDWALETEITEGQGAVRANGRLRLELTRTADQTVARTTAAHLNAAGYPAVVESLRDAQGGALYTVCVLGIATLKDREALRSTLQALVTPR